jgi:hypothetical protein
LLHALEPSGPTERRFSRVRAARSAKRGIGCTLCWAALRGNTRLANRRSIRLGALRGWNAEHKPFALNRKFPATLYRQPTDTTPDAHN